MMLYAKVIALNLLFLSYITYVIANDLYSAGGLPVDIKDFPYQVSIQYSFYGHVCGGVILQDKWILTTARCVENFIDPDPTLLTVIAGITALDDEDAKTYQVLRAIIHEDFEGSPLPEFDIALIELSEPLPLGTSGIQKIDLPDQDFEPEALFIQCNFTGWGSSVMGGEIPWDLQLLDQYLLNFNVCNTLIASAGGFELPLSTICTTSSQLPPYPTNGPCTGEWGSPLACDLDQFESPLLLGLLSGDPLFCGLENLPNFFTKVSSFRTWVDEKIESS